MTRRIYLVVACSFCITLILVAGVVAAQDVPISSLPMLYNGGFAGEVGAPRLASFSKFRAVHIRAYPDYRYGQYVAYDNFIKKVRSGVGLTVAHSNARSRYNGNLGNTSASLVISPKFSFQGNTTLAPSVDFTFINSSYSLMEGTPPSDNPLLKHNYLGLIRAGLLYNWRCAYLGVAAVVVKFDKANEGVYRFHRGVSSEPAVDFQGGYTFQRKPDSKFSITPQVAIRLQRKYRIYFEDLNISLRYKKCLIGFNQAGVMLGLQNDRFRIQLSQDFKKTRFEYFDSIRGEMIYKTGFFYRAAVSLRYVFVEGKQPRGNSY